MAKKIALTQANLARFVELNKNRRKLEADARKLKKELSALEAEIKQACSANGGSFKRFGFICLLTPNTGRPDWEGEFIAKLGADTAAKIQAAAPPQLRLTVQASAP